MRPVLLLAACLTWTACGPAGPPPHVVKLAHLPPTAKDVIAAALESSGMPLADSSCKGYGTEPTDRTVGRYLAGFLAELGSQDARNAVTTSVEQKTENGQPVYICRLTIRHAQGEDVWSWGLEFTARRSDGVVVAGSIRCIGAG